MTAFNRHLQKALAAVSGLAMALVFGIILINSVRRYTTGESMQLGEELPIYLAVYGVMFAVALAYLQDTHIRFTALTDLLPDGLRRRFFLATDVLTLAAGVALARSGIDFAGRRGAMEASGLIGAAQDLVAATGASWLIWLGRMGTWQAAMAVGGGLLALAALVRMAVRLREG